MWKKKNHKNDTKELLLQVIFSTMKSSIFWSVTIIVALLVISATTLIQPEIIKMISDMLINNKHTNDIIMLFMCFAVLKIIQNIFIFLQNMGFAKWNNLALDYMYNKTLKKALKMHYDYYCKHSYMEITDAVKSDINKITSIFNQVGSLASSNIIQVCFWILGISRISIKLMILILLWFPIKLLISNIFLKARERIYSNYIIDDNRLHTIVGDWLYNILIVKLWNIYDAVINKINTHINFVKRDYYDGVKVDGFRDFIENMCDILIYGSIIIYGSMLVKVSELDVSDIVAILTCAFAMINSITIIINIRYYFAGINPALKRMAKFLNEPTETYKESKQYIERNNEPEIEFRNVSFSYSKCSPVLNNVSFKIYKGEKVAIIGDNGAGKSTIFKLICRLYAITSGEIYFRGNNIAMMDINDLRNNISMIPQVSYLINSTVIHNIDIEEKYNLSIVKNYCKKLGIDSFINNKKDSYNYNVGYQGEKLSGGEKRKIVLARSIVKDADILLLDEPFNEYDKKSKDFSLLEDAGNKTIITITHDIDNIKNCVDKIFKLEEGKLIEMQKIF